MLVLLYHFEIAHTSGSITVEVMEE